MCLIMNDLFQARFCRKLKGIIIVMALENCIINMIAFSHVYPAEEGKDTWH